MILARSFKQTQQSANYKQQNQTKKNDNDINGTITRVDSVARNYKRPHVKEKESILKIRSRKVKLIPAAPNYKRPNG